MKGKVNMNKNKILDIAKQNNGYITTELITKQGIAKMFFINDKKCNA